MIKSDKREKIVKAALELIAEHGFHGAPMSMIAERGKVAAGTIYRHFDSKDTMVNEIYRELEENIMEFILVGYPAGSPIRERFIHIGENLLKYFISNPLVFRYVEQFHNSPYGAAYRREMIFGQPGSGNICRDLFEEGVARQAMKDLPLAALYALTFGPLLTLARDHILGFIKLDDHLIELTVSACWDAVIY